ncbi:MAG: MerR family transcriptional regulator [Candidatus Acidulodesulfobacterium ferriphilum]|jgi:DNA-binding transcriptional MerR regulator|uniref:MerR family transcriptional regulator n=1 Tax=Candidatus Acidulodesulfobacterium ferriphilum TaxID=2597223 RepID=A0A519BC55_9DELT|nr:MerR family transcriptional regulator [Deltaproteobacteria bacterium]RZD14857.1 MAG: MerR family transcriptional regulator [Candidatus Acidulodesulfobacterium ferriphilum]
MDPVDEKLYYKIGEVAKIIEIEPYVIRYWETEFNFLKPHKSKSSHRLYLKSDIDKLLLIKDYLYNKKFTIEGAKKAIKAKSSQKDDNIKLIKNIHNELNSVKSLLLSRKK